MKIIESDNIIYFDCDDTLVMWDAPQEARNNSIKFNNYGWTENLVPNFRMIDVLKRNFEQGAFIIVWSQNGYKWASEVVKKLGLTKFVHQVQTKPKLIFDDIAPEEFIKRAYVKPDYSDVRYYQKNKES